MSGSLACDPVVYTGQDQCWIVWGSAFTGDTNIDCTSERPRGPVPDVSKVSIKTLNFSEGPDPGNRSVLPISERLPLPVVGGLQLGMKALQ